MTGDIMNQKNSLKTKRGTEQRKKPKSDPVNGVFRHGH